MPIQQPSSELGIQQWSGNIFNWLKRQNWSQRRNHQILESMFWNLKRQYTKTVKHESITPTLTYKI